MANNDLARLLLGAGPSGYGVAQVMGAICTAWDPATYANAVSDGANRWTNLPVLAPTLMTTGRVALLNTPGLPIILGNLYVPDIQTQTAATDIGFTSTRQADPNRTEVTDSGGNLLATFTDGARTAVLTGAHRNFTEQKDSFTDQFTRTIATGWGSSPEGGRWDDFNGSTSDYSVSSGAGRILASTTNVSRYVRLNDTVSTYDVRMTVTTTTTPTGAANSAAVVSGWASTSDHYRTRLTFNTSGSVVASINVVVGGTETTIAGPSTIAASGYVANQVWNIRATFDGTTRAMYTWKNGDPEPGTPTLTVADTTYPTGKLGVRALASSGATNTPTFVIDNYTATAAWPSRPVVTHNSYVRLLPAPFAGVVDLPWLTSALADTTPDLLAVAMEYITGGANEAGYGPLDTDGTRLVGADWNDFLGVTGNYPDLATPTTDSPEAAELGCLDCSGYVRTVFGYRGGMPMALTTGADFNGLRIPRTSVDQGTSGPGILIASSTGAPPAVLSNLLPGDVLFWDADTSDPTEEEGQIDHNGIYLGVDALGSHRFLSSRKTANGPTLGDLGGPSTITGTGLYARSLRKIRRY